MSAHTEALTPLPGERGVASYAASDVALRVLTAWDAFLPLAAQVELDAPSRLPGWSGRDVLVHLGSWDTEPALQRLVADARSPDPVGSVDRDAKNARLVSTHRDASRAEVLDALRAARQAAVDLFDAPDLPDIGRRETGTQLGALPLVTAAHATSYELAVHALDLAPAGCPAPPPELLAAALGALVDVTGALAARDGLRATAAVMTPEGGWAFGASGEDWTTVELPVGAVSWPNVEGAAATLLDVSAGRASVPPLLVRRELRAHHVGELMALAPLLEQVPGLPGGAALHTAGRYVGGLGRVVRHLPRLPGHGR